MKFISAEAAVWLSLCLSGTGKETASYGIFLVSFCLASAIIKTPVKRNNNPRLLYSLLLLHKKNMVQKQERKGLGMLVSNNKKALCVSARGGSRKQ